jgi:small conductance mechanosensitive channel
MYGVLEETFKQMVVLAPRVLIGMILFLAFLLAGIAVKRLILHLGVNSREGVHQILVLLGGSAQAGLAILGGVTALGTMGVNVAALVAGLGLTGFALGFAFRDALSNLLAGAMLILYRPFRRGDHISVSGNEGTVQEVNLRYTVLQGENRTFLIPNGILFTTTIILLKD